MKNLITIALSFLLIISCEGKPNPTKTFSDTETIMPYQEIKPIDSAEAKKILETPTYRYTNSLNGYDFNLPFNYRIRFIDSEKRVGSYYKFQWKINDKFAIDSDAKGFKRFSVYNFISYLPSGTEEGNFFMMPSNGSFPLKISDFLQETDGVFYQDQNSAIFKQMGKIRAFYFEYLPKSQEYLVYLSDTPFWNKRPEPNSDEELNQLLNQIRLAKNILKPIGKQDKSWNGYKNQFSKLEKDFFDNINNETKKAFDSDKDLKSYAPADQGNFKYYTVLKMSPETEAIWKKMQSVQNNGVFTLSEKDKEFKYLSDNNIRFFNFSDNKQIEKNNLSIVYKRNSEDSFCLMTKTKDNQFIIFKEFPALTEMSKDYYKSEIEFYRELFENY